MTAVDGESSPRVRAARSRRFSDLCLRRSSRYLEASRWVRQAGAWPPYVATISAGRVIEKYRPRFFDLGEMPRRTIGKVEASRTREHRPIPSPKGSVEFTPRGNRQAAMSAVLHICSDVTFLSLSSYRREWCFGDDLLRGFSACDPRGFLSSLNTSSGTAQCRDNSFYPSQAAFVACADQFCPARRL